MPRIKGSSDLSEVKRDALIEVSKANNISNRQLAKRYQYDKKTVANVLKRAGDAEKENIDPLSSKAHRRRPQPGRSIKIDDRQLRILIRHVTKNKFQRRKPWLTIARELGIITCVTAVNTAFVRAEYDRYPPLYKPPLSPQMKAKRLGFVTE